MTVTVESTEISTLLIKVLITALLLTAFHSGGVLADEKHTPLTPADTSSPRSTLTGFIEAVNGSHARIETALSSYLKSPRLYFSIGERDELDAAMGQIDLARRTLNLSELPKALAGTDSVLRASIFQLKEVLDRLELPAPYDIPDRTAMESREFKRWMLPGTEILIERVEQGPRAGEYLFSPETVQRLPEFYERIRHLPYQSDVTAGWYERYLYGGAGLRRIVPLKWMRAMPDWANVIIFDQPMWRWLGLVIVGLFATGGFLLVRRASDTFARHEPTSELRVEWSRLIKVASLLILIPAVIHVLTINLRLSGLILEVFTLTLWAVFSLTLTWTVWMGSSVLAETIVSSQQLNVGSIDSQLVRLALRLTAMIISVAILVISAQQLGLPAYSVIAGLGVGGIAFALAAKDGLANLLGSLLIMFEKPFRVGHWIRVGKTEGFVESIGFRSTRIRTFHNSLISIPSDQLVNSVVDNMALRERLAVRVVLKISYTTPANTVEQFLAGITKLIEASSHTFKKWFRIRLDDFGEHGMHILVNFSLEMSKDRLEETERQRILLEILRLAETMNIQLVDRGLGMEQATTSAEY